MISKQWAGLELSGGEYHVVPVGDVETHEGGLECWCEPVIEAQPDGKMKVSHNAADFREILDTHLLETGH